MSEQQYQSDWRLNLTTGQIVNADSLPICNGSVLRILERQAREIADLERWVADCQSGMYVNCVYCGHRYGPREDTPVAMADVLREHIEQCPKHPLSAAKAQIEQLTKTLTQVYAALHKLTAVTSYLDDPAVLLEIPQPHRMKLSELLHGKDN